MDEDDGDPHAERRLARLTSGLSPVTWSRAAGVLVLAYECGPRLCGSGPGGVLVLAYFVVPGYADPGRGGTGPRLSGSPAIFFLRVIEVEPREF